MTSQAATNILFKEDLPLICLNSGCPHIFRNNSKTFIRLFKTVRCQKIRPLCQLGKVNSIYYDIGLNKLKGPC